ncbi:MAG: RnfABCDGE type electron transport complex subunit B [Gammaproteobacteria bacterium]
MVTSAAPDVSVLADQLDALLPQTQCTRCGYAGCRPYAEAMAAGEALPNRCPPGGPTTLAALARRLGSQPLTLDSHCGEFLPPRVAVIDEEACIGCAKCLPACPVDAILGARKQLHVVVAAECNGCELCLAPCPVDCIRMEATGETLRDEARLKTEAAHFRQRHAAHGRRHEERARRREAALTARAERWRSQRDCQGEPAE